MVIIFVLSGKFTIALLLLKLIFTSFTPKDNTVKVTKVE